jgi:mannose-6-phosphate isomerase-like protein (cupin superfamily)
VLPVGSRHESERGTSIEIVSRDAERMSFDRVYAPRSGHDDPHYHLDFTQTWEALEGEGMVEVDGTERPLAAGEKVVIAPDTPHRDPWLPGEGPFKVRGTFEPCNAFIEGYAETWAHHLRQGSVDDQDQIPLLQIFVLVKATDGQSFRAGVPRGIQKAALPLIALVARLRGYRASYD